MYKLAELMDRDEASRLASYFMGSQPILAPIIGAKRGGEGGRIEGALRGLGGSLGGGAIGGLAGGLTLGGLGALLGAILSKGKDRGFNTMMSGLAGTGIGSLVGGGIGSGEGVHRLTTKEAAYYDGFTDKLMSIGRDVVFEKAAQAVMPGAPKFDADQFRKELEAMNPDDITGDWIGNSMNSYYGGPEKVRKEFGWAAPMFYDNEEVRNELYNLVAGNVQELRRRQIEELNKQLQP